MPAKRAHFNRTTPPHILTLVVITGLSALSLNVFLPSLPAMSEYFETDYDVMQLTVTLYLASNAVLQLVIGPISDHFGRRPTIIGGLLVFMGATIGCIYAPTIEVFLFFRMVQALIVVGMVLGRAIVRDTSDEANAASRIGYVTMGMAMIPMIGPMIGGVLEDWFDWRASFWLMLILALATLLLVWLDLGETAPKRSGGFRNQLQDYPELLLSPRFWGYCLTAGLAAGVFFAFLGGGPFVGAEIFGLDVTQLGLYLGAPAVGYVVGNWASGRFSVRLGINTMVLLGTGITSIGMLVLLIITSAGLLTAPLFFGFMVTVGLGNGIALPNANSGLLSVRPHLAGTASGLGGAIMLAGGATFAAFAGASLQAGGGALPLITIQFATSLMSLLITLYTIRRTKQVQDR